MRYYMYVFIFSLLSCFHFLTASDESFNNAFMSAMANNSVKVSMESNNNNTSNITKIFSNVAGGVWGSCTAGNLVMFGHFAMTAYNFYQSYNTPSATITDDSLQKQHKMYELATKGILIRDDLAKMLISCEKQTELNDNLENAKKELDIAQQESIASMNNNLKYQQNIQKKFYEQEVKDLEKKIKEEQDPELKKLLQEILDKKKRELLKLYN